MPLAPVFTSIIVHHLLRDILSIADRRSAARLAIRAPRSAVLSCTILTEWARATSPIACDGIFDDQLFNLNISLIGELTGHHRE